MTEPRASTWIRKRLNPTSAYTFSAYLPAASNFVLLPFILTNLSIADFGVLSFLIACYALMSSVMGLGLPESIVYHVGRWSTERRTISPVPSALVLGITLGAVSFALLFVGLLVLGNEFALTSDAIALACWIASFNLMSNVVRSIAIGLQIWGSIVLERVVTSSIRLVAILVLVFFGQVSISGILASQLLTVAAGFLTLCFGAARKIQADSISLQIKPHQGQFKIIIRLAIKSAPSSLLGPLLSRLDQLLLLRLSNAETLGSYSASISVVEGLTLSTSGFRDLTSGQQARDLDISQIAKNSKHAFYFALTVSSCFGVVLIFLGDFISNTSYAESIIPLAILLSASVIGAPGSIAGAVLIGRGRPHRRTFALLVALVVNIALLLWTAPALGALGAAVATACAGLVAGWINIHYCKRDLDVPLDSFYFGWRKHERHT